MPDEKNPAAQTDEREPLLREFLKLIGALFLLAALGFYLAYSYLHPPRPPAPTRLVDVGNMTLPDRDLCGPPMKDGSPIVISMLYSETMQPWVEDAAERFARGCPSIQVRLTRMGDIEAAETILEGQSDPTLWAPADEFILRYVEHQWREKAGEDLFDINSQKPLVRSPLVVLMWEDRARVVEDIFSTRRDGEGPWMKLACALIPREPGPEEMAIEDMVPGRWIDWYTSARPEPAPAKKPARAVKKPVEPKKYELPFPTPAQVKQWGLVKLVHASPTRTASGLEAIYLMALDYALPPGERGAPKANKEAAETGGRPAAAEGAVKESDHLRGAFQQALASKSDALRRWLRRCEAGLDGPPRSTELLTETMFNVGGASYDGVITYEHLALPVLARVDEHEGQLAKLRVLYLEPTFVNRHPVVHLRPGDPTRKEQHEAADRWINFLRSAEMQKAAIQYNFRPVIPEVTIRGYRDKNLFLDLRRYGVSFESALEEPPRLDGEAVGDLIEIWKDATGRN